VNATPTTTPRRIFVIELAATGEPVEADRDELTAWTIGEALAAETPETLRLIAYTLH
jgi:hypothetical protein